MGRLGVIRRYGLSLLACLLVWGCAQSQPQREITAAFRAFLADVQAGDQEKMQSAAPFLGTLKPVDRELALQPFQLLASAKPDTLSLDVSRGAGMLYLLRVSVPGRTPFVVPFIRNTAGSWEISPVLSEVQHIDVVPAR